MGALGVLLLVCASLLVWSARWHWAGELAASFAWYLGLAGVLGALLLLCTERRRLAGFACLLSILHCGPELMLWIPSSAPSRRPSQTLTIATSNLLWHNRDYEALAQWIERNDPDIIAFQEVSPHSRDVLLAMSKGYPHMVFEPPLEDWDSLTWGLAILSKAPLKNQRRVPIEGTPWKGILEVQAQLDGEPLLLRNMHPTRPGGSARNAERNAALHAAQSATWGGRSLLLGDLNVTSTSPIFSDLLAATGLRDSRQGFGRQPTYRIKQPLPGLMVAIDHVLVSDQIEVLERRVEELPGSDHLSLVLEIQGVPRTGVLEAERALPGASDSKSRGVQVLAPRRQL